MRLTQENPGCYRVIGRRSFCLLIFFPIIGKSFQFIESVVSIEIESSLSNYQEEAQSFIFDNYTCI